MGPVRACLLVKTLILRRGLDLIRFVDVLALPDRFILAYACLMSGSGHLQLMDRVCRKPDFTQ